MIDDEKPLPEDKTTFSKKHIYTYGPWRRILYCEACKWFATPMSNVDAVCPECGEYRALKYKIGRYKYEDITGRFIGTSTHIIGVDIKGDYPSGSETLNLQTR